MVKIPKSHPRAASLLIREKLVDGFNAGLVSREGLLAHGRGEAFDYILGEKSNAVSKKACRAAAAMILLARHPVISVNGNAAALCAREMVGLARASGAVLEVNVFYSGNGRRKKIADALAGCGAKNVLGTDLRRSSRLSGVDSARRVVDVRGIAAADLVLVALEDGDRTAALKAAGKAVIAIDLNPLSRTAQDADITIVDNLVRSSPLLAEQCRTLSGRGRPALKKITDAFDNGASLALSVSRISSGLAKKVKCVA